MKEAKRGKERRRCQEREGKKEESSCALDGTG